MLVGMRRRKPRSLNKETKVDWIRGMKTFAEMLRGLVTTGHSLREYVPRWMTLDVDLYDVSLQAAEEEGSHGGS